MPRIVLCDDHPVFVDALAVVLGRYGFTVEAVVNDVSGIVPAITRHRPELCLIDRNFGADDGLLMIGPVRAACPATRVLMLTADRDEQTARRALAAGAAGYLCKTAGLSAVVDTIRAVLSGGTAVEVVSRSRRSRQDADAHRLAGYLTKREWECLALIVEGHNSGGIAERLGVSVTTVRTHVQSMLTKLGVHSRLEAASFAVRHSLLVRSA